MRIRTLKPEFWKNEHLARLPDSTRLLAIGLLNYADDEGYFNANPSLIKADIFPFLESSKTIPIGITELSNIGYLKLYNATDGRTYGHIVKFTEHQWLTKPKPSKIKPLCIISDNSETIPMVLLEQSVLDQGSGIREKDQGTGTSAMPKEEPKQRPRNLVMDELATVAGIPLNEIGAAVAKRLQAVISTIKQSTPDVTPEEIRRRAANYRTHMRDANLTAEALAKHWGLCHAPNLHNEPPKPKGAAPWL